MPKTFLAQGARINNTAVARVIDPLRAKIEQLKADRDLTPEAKAKRIATLEREIADELGARRAAQISLVQAAERDVARHSPARAEREAALRDPARTAALLQLARALPAGELAALVEHAAEQQEPDVALAFAVRHGGGESLRALDEGQRQRFDAALAKVSRTPEYAMAEAEAVVTRLELARFETIAESDPTIVLNKAREAVGGLGEAAVRAHYATAGVTYEMHREPATPPTAVAAAA